MQAANTAQHSSYASLTPSECAIKYRNRDLLGRFGCAAAAVVLTLVACWPYVMGQAGWPRLLLAIPIVVACVAVEFLLFSRWGMDFQGIVTNDCDPAKMLKVEELLLGRIKNRRTRAQHLLIASQAAMLTGDVARSRQLRDEAVATGKLAGSFKFMALNIGIGCANLEKDWQQVSSLRDEVAASYPKARGVLKAGLDQVLAFADEALAATEGDLQTAETLLDKIDALAKLPEQQASAAFRRAELETLKGNDEAARPHYMKAEREGGTCFFAREAAAWLAAH